MISQFLRSKKRGKRFSVVSTTPPNSRAVSATRGNSMSAFHPRTPTLFLCSLSLSLSLSRSALHLSMSCPPSRVLVSQLARKHTHAHKQAEKKTSIKSLWNEASAPQHNTKQQERSVWFSSWSGSCSLKVKADLWPESRWKAVRLPRTGYLTLGHSQVVDDFGYFHSYQVWMCATV